MWRRLVKLQGLEMCFKLLVIKRNISFYDSQKVCSSHNASLFTVDISKQSYPSWKYKELEKHLTHATSQVYPNGIPKTYGNINMHYMQYILFGRHVDHSPHNMLLHTMLSIRQQEYMSYFAYFNNLCTVVVFSAMSYYYDDTIFPTHGWGVKCRPCEEAINVSGILCEKPRVKNTITCERNQFQCDDGTCILYMYRCDSIRDCFDDTDEINCFLNTSLSQYIAVSCFLNGECDISSEVHILVQGICDGIYVNHSIPDENNVCSKMIYQAPKAVMESHVKKNIEQRKFASTDLVALANHEIKYMCDNTSDIITSGPPGTATQTFLDNHLTNNTTEECNFKNLCKFGGCHWLSSCRYHVCPGMFKCPDSYCIDLSSVCDDIHDCRRGEDELMCHSLTCPGFLKCRGEDRCVGTNEICDGYVNCVYSMDDEMDCNTCPGNCDCQGYVMSCSSNNSIQLIANRAVSRVKGLRLYGIQNELITKQLNCIGLIFINISFCELHKIEAPDDIPVVVLNVLICVFRNNHLLNIQFLQTITFHNVIFVDVSFNLIYSLHYGTGLSLKYTRVLILMGNPLAEINVVPNYSKLTLVDMKYIQYYTALSVSIYPNMNIDLVVEVTDSKLCCMLPEHTKCVTMNNTMKCNGLIDSHISKIVFYLLSLLSLTMSLVICYAQIINIILQTKTRRYKNKYYLLILINQTVSNILTSLYLATIALSDAINVNVLFFTESFICVFLNAIIFISFETTVIFKTFLFGFKILKIIYPFEHQCVLFKWFGRAIFIIWISVTLTYILNIFFILSVYSIITFDNLCSLAWCGMHVHFYVLHGMIYFIDIICISTHVLASWKVHSVLKIQLRNAPTCNKQYSPSIVTFRLNRPNCSEFILRLYLFSILTAKLLDNLTNESYCMSLFLYIMPVNLFIACVLYF